MNTHSTKTQSATLTRVNAILSAYESLYDADRSAVSVYDTPHGVVIAADSRRGDIGHIHALSALVETFAPGRVRRLYDKNGRGCYAVRLTIEHTAR